MTIDFIGPGRPFTEKSVDDAARLRAHDWTAFAHAYNGPNFSANNYDGKLRVSYQRLKNGKAFDLDVRTAQVYLRYLGFYSGRIDGIAGPTTARVGEDAEPARPARDRDPRRQNASGAT